MGPGVAIKALCGGYFSLSIFGLSQVLIDIEPLVRILRHDAVLHGVTHTYLGATAIGCVTVAIARPFYSMLFAVLHRLIDHGVLFRVGLTKPISWASIISGAFIGTYSHVALDSIMHSDLVPFYPFSQSNPLLGVLSFDSLHLMCVILGILGSLGVMIMAAFKKNISSDQRPDA